MVKLFLSQPRQNDSGTIDQVILPLLNKLGSHIRSLVTGGARSEARLWLCTALSTISISPRRQLNVFMRLLRPKPRKMQLVSQLLQMMFDKSPRKLGREILSRESEAYAAVLKMKHVGVIRILGLLSWTIHFRLSEECQTPDSWEFLFKENGIEFRRSSDHSLLSHYGFSEESESDSDGKSHVSNKRHKRRKNKRKKKKKSAIDDDDELLGLHQISRSWLLSTDGFSATWTSVDLPEYISKYCLSTWMKWLLARQK